VTATIQAPREGGGTIPPEAFSHTAWAHPDNKTLWVNSTLADAVFAYSLPDLKLLGHVVPGYTRLDHVLSDGKTVYDSNRATIRVSHRREESERGDSHPGRQAPERNATLVLP